MSQFLLLVLSLSPAQPPDKPPTPAEQYKAITKEFGEATRAKWLAKTDEEHRQAGAKAEPLPPKLIELIEKNPKEPWVFDGLTSIITMEYWLDNYSNHTGWGKDSPQARALAILQRGYLQSDKLG